MLKCLLSNDNITVYYHDWVKNFIDYKVARKEMLYEKINYIVHLLSLNIQPPQKLYKKVENDIWEIRYHDIRIFCYRKNNKIFLFNIMVKKRDRIGNIETLMIRKTLLETKIEIAKIF